MTPASRRPRKSLRPRSTSSVSQHLRVIATGYPHTYLITSDGIGSDSGVLVTDVVAFGGVSTNQIFAATNVNDQFSIVGASTALLGLAWSQLAQTNTTPFVQSLWLSGQLDEPLFSLAFARSASGQKLEGAGLYVPTGAQRTFTRFYIDEFLARA